MEYIKDLIEIFFHIDQHLGTVIQMFGIWTYLILFVTIFSETGLVVTPFLPGDSLLFAAGSIAALGTLNPHSLFILLAVAAVAGNTVNYTIGKFFGPKIFTREDVCFLNKKYLDQAHAFYEKHGGKAVIIARFAPIIRTFVPFVAGIAKMTYLRYSIYNIISSVAWVALFIYAGYYFGTLPVVKSNFSLVIMAIIIISLVPAVWGYLKARKKTE
ncbi:MAG: DedA family protein [Proteobacteria bacterium]|nr:DedA family protein [Pseudomonadota bacterium]